MILKVIELIINEYLHIDLSGNLYIKNNRPYDMYKENFIDFVVSNNNILRQLIFCNKNIYNLVIKYIKFYFNNNQLLFYSNNLYVIITYKLSDHIKYKWTTSILYKINKFNKKNIAKKKYSKYNCDCRRCKYIMVTHYFLSYNWTYNKNKNCLYKYDKYNLINKNKLLGCNKIKKFKLKSPIFIY